MQGVTKTYLLVCEGQCNLAFRENETNKFFVRKDMNRPRVTTHTFSHAAPPEDSASRLNYVKLIFTCSDCGSKRVFGTMLNAS